VIVGHTDAVGTDSYNQGLSERRAGSAASYLSGQGIPGERIEGTGKGEAEPIAENESEAGRSQNRRIEVAIFASEEYRKELLRKHGG
jgi:outer membrane protein OmpA-like peptidoglycan-associated protein